MIQELKGMFLSVPMPYQLTMNLCSHFCHYCFANLDNPDRTFDEKATFNQLLKYRKSETVVGEFLRRKFPILASNLVDVFAKNNYKHFLEIYKILRRENIPIAFQTRGGFGVDDVLKTLPKSYFYISLTSHDDQLAKVIEPNAPPPSERIKLIKKLHELGHNIEIGVNPYMKDFCDIEKVMQQTREYTNMYWLNGFHINNNQKRNLTPKGIKALESEMTKPEAQKDEELRAAFETMVEYGTIPSGYPYYTLVDRTKLFDCYENKLPMVNDFALHIVNTKKEGDLIHFEDYYNFFKDKFPAWLKKFDSGYKVTVKRCYSKLESAYTLEEILQFHWNNYMIAESSIVSTTLSIFPNEDIKDQNGNAILNYNIKPFIHQ